MMDKINFDTSLNDFVSLYPETIEVFEKIDLDYMSENAKKLGKIAKDHDILLDELKVSLKKIIMETPPKKRSSLTEIIQHVEKRHHAFLWENLPSTDILMNKIVEMYGKQHGDFVLYLKNIFADLKESLENHLLTEEDIIFDYVKKIEMSKTPKNIEQPRFAAKIIQDLYEDHKKTLNILKTIRGFTSNYELPDYACDIFEELYEKLQAIEKDLHAHIYIEDSVLLPRIEKMLK